MRILESLLPSSVMQSIRVELSPDNQRWPYQDAQSANDVRLWYTAPPHEPRPADDDAFEYVSGSDLFAVEWKNASRSLSLDARHVDYEGASNLCNACLSALGYLAQNVKDCIEHEG